ncbi:MAG TPA: serpin family protein [Longimicrobium sp.]|nr:serpin family protein [Longimicrobium sp.]
MRSFLIRPLATAAVLTLGAGCVSAQEDKKVDARDAQPLDTQPWQVPPAQLPFSATVDYGAFGLGLFRQLADARPNENVVVSPLSAGLALSMLANGAQGETLAGIRRTLVTDAEIGALNATNQGLAQALRTGDVELAIANSLWARQGVPFLPAFLERNRRFYDAEVTSLDLSTPQAAERINRWASEKTNGRITQMVRPPLDPDLVLYLMNAVYFKGRWADEFQASQTRPMPFHAPGGTVQRPMMQRTGSYGYLRADGFQALRLPYRGDRFAMYVLLPDAGASVAALRGRLTPDAWAGWMRGLGAPREVRVVMPRYRVNVESQLNEPLQALGMADAFSPSRANFGAMLPAEYLARQNAYVSEAKQKVFIEVNEEGTEAAAVTGIGVRTTSMPAQPLSFVVDRPFILAIRDDQTGALLFIGQVNDPVTE